MSFLRSINYTRNLIGASPVISKVVSEANYAFQDTDIYPAKLIASTLESAHQTSTFNYSGSADEVEALAEFAKGLGKSKSKSKGSKVAKEAKAK